jgi:hypothetical protein
MGGGGGGRGTAPQIRKLDTRWRWVTSMTFVLLHVYDAIHVASNQCLVTCQIPGQVVPDPSAECTGQWTLFFLWSWGKSGIQLVDHRDLALQTALREGQGSPSHWSNVHRIHSWAPRCIKSTNPLAICSYRESINFEVTKVSSLLPSALECIANKVIERNTSCTYRQKSDLPVLTILT